MKVVASAPGKVQLVGEYSVLFGKPTILAAIDRRTVVEVMSAKQTRVSSDLVDAEEVAVVRAAVERAIMHKLGLDSIPSYAATIRSSVPIGMNLGSSAAVATAYCAALARYLSVPTHLEDPNVLAYEVEKIFHGSPSGGDNTISTVGGVLWFRCEMPGTFVYETAVMHESVLDWQFCLVDSGHPAESTREMIAKLQSAIARNHEAVDETVRSMEQIAHFMRSALRRGDWNSYSSATREAQECLSRLGAVGEHARTIAQALEQSGCAAKVTGAGGYATGSGMLLVAAPDTTTIVRAVQRTGLTTHPIHLGEPGCQVEQFT